MAKGRYQQSDGENEDEWLNTYADAITLLLCFFIILISVMEPKVEKFEALTEGFVSGFVTETIELPFKSLFEDFQLIIEEHQVEMLVATEYTDDGVRVDIGASALFNSGSAVIKKEAVSFLQEAAISIQELDLDDYRVEVEGHTDDVPSKGQYASNWELSAARAAGVVRFLAQEGIEKQRLFLSGYADTQPKVDNLDRQGIPIPENREQNRRIVIHVMRVY